MRVLGIVMARAGSKGVPGKNLRMLGGPPLIAHAITAARKAELIDRLILTTEDEGIAEVGRTYGIEVPFMRPAELADDRATGLDVAKHAMDSMDALGYRADVVVYLFPTCPFVPPEKIDGAVRLVVQGFDSGMALRRVEHEHPYRVQTLDEDGCVTPFLKEADAGGNLNRQDFPDVYLRAGAVYARRRELFERWNGVDFCLGDRNGGVVLSDLEATNIDREIDFSFTEFLIQQGLVRTSLA